MIIYTDRIVFVGGGYISFEFAHIAERAGARVTILHRGKQPLEHFDPDLVNRLVQRSRDIGIDIRLQVSVRSIDKSSSTSSTSSTTNFNDDGRNKLVVYYSSSLDISKETSLSPKTVARRLDKMRENHVLQFSTSTNLSSMQVTGYIEFVVLIRVHAAYHQNIVQRIYNEMQEYILRPLDELLQYPFNFSISYRRELVIASFCCANISTVNLILRRLESYDGVNKVEPITITSGRVYQDWLRNEIDKRIAGSQEYSSSSADWQQQQ